MKKKKKISSDYLRTYTGSFQCCTGVGMYTEIKFTVSEDPGHQFRAR